MKINEPKTQPVGMSTIPTLLIEQAAKIHPKEKILDSGRSHRKNQLK